MSTPLQIFQYQAVNFTDTTTGASPFTLSWSFPGGIPLSGTSSTQTVYYNVPGTYNVSLTATDIYGTAKTLLESNLIQVDPSTLIGGITGPIPSSVKMGESYTVYDATVGNPYPAISWLWNLPTGQTAGTQNVTVNGYNDWYALTGYYSGSPGSIFIGNISLTADNGYNTASAGANISVQKLGRAEELFINITGGAPTANIVVPGFSGTLPLSSTLGPGYNLPIKTTEFGYIDSYYVAKMDFSTRGSTNKTNQYFHSTNETAGALITSGLWDPSTFIDVFGGFLVIDGAIYNDYSSLPYSDGVSLGGYLTGGQSTQFFIADEGGLFEDLYENRNYNVQLITYLLSSPYKNLHSGNLQYMNNYYSTNPLPVPGSPSTQMTFPGTGGIPGIGLSGSNPLVPSSFYLNSMGSTVLNPVYEVYIDIEIPPSTFNITASFGPAGTTGNYGDFFVAQDTPDGPGMASRLNSAINLAIPGGTGFVEFIAASSANCDYSSPTGPDYDPTNYYGLIAVFRNDTPVPVYNVSIWDNSYTLSNYFAPPLAIPPFTADFANPQGSFQTCSGLYPASGPTQITVTRPLNPPYSIMSMGGTIGYP